MECSDMNYVTTCVSLDSCGCCFFFLFVCLFVLVFYNLKAKKLCATHHGIQSYLNHNIPFF